MCCYVAMQQPVEEILSQLAYKDSRIIELDGEIQQLHQTIIDLREGISEKDEVIRARDEAVQIMRAAQAKTELNVDREAECRDESPAVSQTDSSAAMSLLQQQVQDAGELIATQEQSVTLLTEQLTARDQYIAELTSHLTDLQNHYAVLQASYSDLADARNAAIQSCAELEKRFADREKMYKDFLAQQSNLQENVAALERQYAAVQASHAELNQRYTALEDSYCTQHEQHKMLEKSFTELQVTHLELEQAHAALAKSHSELQAGNVSEADVAADEDLLSQLTDQKRQCEELRDSLTDCESKFSKFKSLAGSKIKALEKELAALHEVTIFWLSR